MQVDFYPIPVYNLNKLIRTKMAFDIKMAELFFGNIRLDRSTDAILGVSTFKTAQSAQLTLSPLTCSGMGSSPNYEVVLKRPYINDFPANEPAGPPFSRFALKDESNILYCKANVLYWAKALLKMTYEFIDHAIDCAKEPPPFNIPCLCFVDAGLLLAYSNAPAITEGGLPLVKTSGIISMMYLGEELIPTPSDGKDFVKYIHNGDAAPCDLLDPDAENIAQFLAFTQHVQYIKTGKQVYISDYQGISVLILDPSC